MLVDHPSLAGAGVGALASRLIHGEGDKGGNGITLPPPTLGGNGLDKGGNGITPSPPPPPPTLGGDRITPPPPPLPPPPGHNVLKKGIINGF